MMGWHNFITIVVMIILLSLFLGAYLNKKDDDEQDNP
jgi:hypothetical protein